MMDENEYLGDVCCADDCFWGPDGVCKICPPKDAYPLCMTHLAEHCIEHKHAARLTRQGLRGTTDFIHDTLRELDSALENLERISSEVACLEDLQVRGLVSMPGRHATEIDQLNDARDEVTDMCCALHEIGHKLERKAHAEGHR